MYNYETGSSGTYVNSREVFARLELEPGDYVIVPATYNSDCAGDFMVRVYSSKMFSLKTLKTWILGYKALCIRLPVFILLDIGVGP